MRKVYLYVRWCWLTATGNSCIGFCERIGSSAWRSQHGGQCRLEGLDRCYLFPPEQSFSTGCWKGWWGRNSQIRLSMVSVVVVMVMMMVSLSISWFVRFCILFTRTGCGCDHFKQWIKRLFSWMSSLVSTRCSSLFGNRIEAGAWTIICLRGWDYVWWRQNWIWPSRENWDTIRRIVW